jgi:hypothetical protein
MIVDFLTNAAKNIFEGYGKIITNGFDETDCHPVHLSHFMPFNQWEGSGLYITDKSNGDAYFNDAPKIKRLKCLALAVATPIVHAVGLVLNAANRIAKLVTFSHFWRPDNNQGYSFEARLCAFGKDLLRVAFSPIIYLGLELSAISGLIFHNDGGKLYATFERCAYGRSLMAPCFQPSPSSHLGDGDVSLPNQW